MPCIALADTEPRVCTESRASKPVIKSAYQFEILPQFLSKRSTALVYAELTSPNADYSSKDAGESSSDGDAFNYFHAESDGTTLVMFSQGELQRFHREDGVIRTIAIGNLSESLVSINDPSGILIGDTRACVSALAGTPMARSTNELDYAMNSHMRRVYRLERPRTRAVDWRVLWRSSAS